MWQLAEHSSPEEYTECVFWFCQVRTTLSLAQEIVTCLAERNLLVFILAPAEQEKMIEIYNK